LSGNVEERMNTIKETLKNKGINTVYDSIPAPITTQMFQKLGAKIEKSDNPKYQFKASI
jgi:methanogenic corrinoid protein MtbC1